MGETTRNWRFLAEDYYKLFGRLVKNKIPKNTQIGKEDVEN